MNKRVVCCIPENDFTTRCASSFSCVQILGLFVLLRIHPSFKPESRTNPGKLISIFLAIYYYSSLFPWKRNETAAMESKHNRVVLNLQPTLFHSHLHFFKTNGTSLFLQMIVWVMMNVSLLFLSEWRKPENQNYARARRGKGNFCFVVEKKSHQPVKEI